MIPVIIFAWVCALMTLGLSIIAVIGIIKGK
jgi:hypothetical protein